MIIVLFIFVLIFGQQIFAVLAEKDLNDKCNTVGISKKRIIKKRRIEMALLLLIMIFIPKQYQKYFVVLLIAVYKQPYLLLNSKLNNLKKSLGLQFSIWLRMMEVLLSYHTVPQAIQASIASAPDLMVKPLQILSEELQYDPLNRDIYLGFMKSYGELNIERSMHHLYRYAVMGSDDATIQLSNMIEDNAKVLIKTREKLFEEKLNFYSWFGLIPMLLVSMCFLGLMFMVLTNLMKGGWNL